MSSRDNPPVKQIWLVIAGTIIGTVFLLGIVMDLVYWATN